jgi:hypothetical protein
MASQRHLRLEQHRYNECAEAYQSVFQELSKVKSEMDAMLTFNEMLRQEIEHSQNIIESMATKLCKYESAANNAIESLKDSWRGTEHDEAPEPTRSSSELGSPSYTLVDESSTSHHLKIEPEMADPYFIYESPPFPITREKSHKRGGSGRKGKQRNVKKAKRSKAGPTKDTEATVETGT